LRHRCRLRAGMARTRREHRLGRRRILGPLSRLLRGRHPGRPRCGGKSAHPVGTGVAGHGA
jgi:hypothetical protein